MTSNHWEFSYSITTSDGQEIDPNNLSRVLREINSEVHDLVRTGWSMFYQFGRDPIHPYFNTDPKSGLGENDFLECALMRDLQPPTFGMDFWRASPNGKPVLFGSIGKIRRNSLVLCGRCWERASAPICSRNRSRNLCVTPTVWRNALTRQPRSFSDVNGGDLPVVWSPTQLHCGVWAIQGSLRLIIEQAQGPGRWAA